MSLSFIFTFCIEQTSVLLQHRINGKTLLDHIASELGDVSKAKYLGLIIEPPGELPVGIDCY